MLLRSSSTPILGSLLSSFSDSPNRDFENSCNKNNKQQPCSDHNLKKISFGPGGRFLSCNSSPVSHSVVGFSDFVPEPSSAGSRGCRRTQSEGNLEALAAAACDFDDCNTAKPLTRFPRRPSMSVLETIPSFSIYNKGEDGYEEEPENEEEEEELNERNGLLGRSVTIGDSIVSLGSGEFSFAKNKNMGLIEEEELGSVVEEAKESRNLPLYLARGIGIDVGGLGDGAGGGSGNGFNPDGFGVADGPEGPQIEEYYKRMVEENPCNPLFLRNYAQFLYQCKGDLRGAEEYYSRSILLDPTDGEIMSQYAKLLWELYHDHERATSYFERAVQAAPGDSHVLAAYASFLWDTEEEEEDSLSQGFAGATVLHMGAMAPVSA